MAAERNYEIRQGESWSVGVTVKKTVDGVTSAVDLTGATVTGAVRERPGAEVAATIECDITDAAAGEVTCSMTDEATALIAGASKYDKTRVYYYDIKVELADGRGMYPLYGTMTIVGGVQIG